MEIHLTWKEFYFLIRQDRIDNRKGGNCDYTRDPKFYQTLGHFLTPEDVVKVQFYNAYSTTLAELVPMQVVKGARVRA